MGRALKLIAACAVILGSDIAGQALQAHYDAWVVLAPERTVAALPGVGQGWIDTLRLVAGNAVVDTVGKKMVRDEGVYLLGVEEPWHGLVSVRTDLRAYAKFIRDSKTWGDGFGYTHPLSMCNPAGVTAHEFGHRFRESLWPHEEVREAGDSLPTWAQGNEEEFADRFARAMLALRGWDYPDTTDAMMNHIVHVRLMLALNRP